MSRLGTSLYDAWRRAFLNSYSYNQGGYINGEHWPRTSQSGPGTAAGSSASTGALTTAIARAFNVPLSTIGAGPVTTAVQDFSGLDFDLAIGEVYGLRVWKMDPYGRLRARNLDKAGPWRPGINVAECHAASINSAIIQGVVDPTGAGRKAVNVEVEYSYSAGAEQVRIEWTDGTRSAHKVDDLKFGVTHAVPDERCSCGFYAYTDPQHEEAATRPTTSWSTITLTYNGASATTPGRFILGIIRGTGHTLIGTKGFRCEKAEIVALRDPTRGGRKNAEWRQQQLAGLKRVYPDVPLLPSRAALLDFAPIESQLPEPDTDEFWNLP